MQSNAGISEPQFAASWQGSVGRDQRQGRKIGTVTHRVACQQRQILDRRMCTNEEARQDTGARAAGAAVLYKRPSGEKERSPRNRRKPDPGVGECRIEMFRGAIAYRHLRIDDVVDQQRPVEGRLFQSRKRPGPPLWISAENIEQNVRVDQGQAAILPASAP